MAVEFNGQKIAHTHLFVAEYKDGEQYEQGQLDQSLQDENKNAFYDIFYQPIKPLADLIRFSLIGKYHKYTVDLTDGHFEIDGVPFKQHEEDFLTDFRLIYFRRHQVDTVVGGEQDGQVTDSFEYHLGWQATHQGKNYQSSIHFS
jgi:hypothetical protein